MLPENECNMWHHHDANDDNVMRASVWFEFVGGWIVFMSKPMIYEREM